MSTYNTNLAAEFYVLSMLYRLGADASLTLGNKKAVDIVVAYKAGRTATIDVKGLQKRYDWPADNIRLPAEGCHFFVLVSFEGKMDDPSYSPSAWIIPAKYLQPFICKYKVRTVISRARVKKNGKRFLHAWRRIARDRPDALK
jgi:hypothetical protein